MRMEEDGGHAVTISLATSLDSEVQAGGDAWQVVRGCQKVVAHLGPDRVEIFSEQKDCKLVSRVQAVAL